LNKDLNCNRCPVAATQSVLSGKWKIVIIWFLRNGPLRFSQIQKLLPTISQTMLTGQLRALEAAGLIHREIYKEIPPRVEYSLTPIGISFNPVLDAMKEWGNSYIIFENERNSATFNKTEPGI